MRFPLAIAALSLSLLSHCSTSTTGSEPQDTTAEPADVVSQYDGGGGLLRYDAVDGPQSDVSDVSDVSVVGDADDAGAGPLSDASDASDVPQSDAGDLGDGSPIDTAGEDTEEEVVAPDDDEDGVANSEDNCPELSNTDQTDTDGDGEGDACDSDDDGDGVLDAEDAFPLDADESVDTDGDGLGDNADTETCDGLDNDGDGLIDNGLVFQDYLPDLDGDGYYGASPAEIQLSCKALMEAGEGTDGVYTIDADGEGPNAPIDVYCDMSTDGGGWTRVFHHDVAGGYWEGDADSLERSIEDPLALRHSILSRLEDFRSSDGTFEFRIDWPETSVDGRNIWRQTSNPTTEDVAGYEAVDVQYTDNSWGGLEYNGFNDSTFIDGSVGIGYWYYAIGSTAAWGQPAGIPSYGPSAARVAIWVRPDDAVMMAPMEPVSGCTAPAGYALEGGDCAPDEPTIHPGASETCDGVDEDCDGVIDQGFTYGYWFPDKDGDGYGAGSGSSCSSLLAEGVESDGVYPIWPAGLDGPTLAVQCDMTTDGGGWTRVFYHDVSWGYFASDDEASSLNVEEPTSGLYSILSELEAFRSSDGSFEFRIEWPDTAVEGRNVWRQTSNPTTGPVTDYVGLDIDYTSQFWGGLELSGTDATYLDGSVSHPNWFYSIGSQVPWNDPPGIPSYNPQASRVALWVRPDDGTNGGSPIYACTEPEGYVENSGDCDDLNEDAHEGASELCNGFDDNCDGAIDEDCPYGDAALSAKPQAMHFYPRDQATDTCTFDVQGELLGVASEVRVMVTRDGEPYLELSSTDALFTVTVDIDAGLHLYDIEVSWNDESDWWKPVTSIQDVVCGDVILIDGQSNAVACDYHGEQTADLEANTFVRSYGSAVSSSAVSGDQTFDVAIAQGCHGHATIGQWGLHMANVLKDAQQMPLLVINGAVGGTTVEAHQRDEANPTNLNTIYGRLLWRVQQAGVEGAVRAIFWHQGESNGTQAYETHLALWTAMYEAWLSDYPNVEGIYPFQVRAGCGGPTWNRNIHRELPDLLDKVMGNMSTTGVDGHDGCHFYSATYTEWGDRMARLVNRDLYGAVYTEPIEAPNPQSASWSSPTELVIDYGATGVGMVLQPGAEVYFSLSDGGVISDVSVVDTAIVLTTDGPSAATSVSFVDVSGDIPWLVNGLGIGGFAYYALPITP
jgi:hypothetical protein